MPTTSIIVVGSAELQLKFLLAEILPDPLPNFVEDLISTPFLKTLMLGSTIVSILMVVILTLSD
jgi:hypothetical protein